MDYPRQSPPGPVFVVFERQVAPLLLVIAVVMAVSLVPVLYLYWTGVGDIVPARRSPTRSARWQSLPVPPVRSTLFRNVNVIPMDADHILAGRDVLISEGRIAAIRPAGALDAPAGGTTVDGAGRFLLPGLVDMHVHLPDGAEREAMLELFAANGVTTVANLRGSLSHLQVRERIARGEILGPTVYTSGPYISNAPFYSPTPDEAAAAVIDQRAAGYDLIKLHGDFSREAYRSVMRAARRVGMKVIGHAPRNIGMDPIFEERQHALAHVEEYIYAYYRFGNRVSDVPSDAGTLTRDIAARTRDAGVQVIANLTAYHGIWKQAADVRPLLSRPAMAFVPSTIRKDWEPERNTYVRRFGGSPEPFERWYRVLQSLVVSLDHAGVPLMAGSDTPIPCVIPGFSLHDELHDLVDAGITPYRALRAATVNAGRFLNPSGPLGTVAVGGRADLVLVEQNPLDHIDALAHPSGVMLRGRWLDRNALDARLAAVADYARAR